MIDPETQLLHDVVRVHLPHRARLKPRPHQREAIAAAVNGFKSADRLQIHMACGTGKTMIGQRVAESVGQTTLVLVPSLSLLSQTLHDWRSNAQRDFEFLCVCSDETVHRSSDSDDDALVGSTSELGVPVTTDSREISAFLQPSSGGPATPKVVFSTYHSSPQVAIAQAAYGTSAFSLVVADEAHYCAGAANNGFGTVLDGHQIRAQHRLFMTATPKIYSASRQEDAADTDVHVVSMDDVVKFGTVAYRLPFAEAIRRGLLSDYRVAIIGVSDASVHTLVHQASTVALEGTSASDLPSTDLLAMNAQQLAAGIGMAKAMQRFDLSTVITFHSRIARAEDFSRDLPTVISWMPREERPSGNITATHVSGLMSAGQRHERLEQLRHGSLQERRVVSNAKCLSVGVDVPALDGIGFMDPRESEIDIIQGVGRTMRLSPNKDIGTIVIPVLIREGATPEQALSSSQFQRIWQIVRALRALDETFAAELDAARRVSRKAGRVTLSGRLIIDLPEAIVGKEFSRAFEIRLVDRTTSSFDIGVHYLQRYFELNGDSAVRQTFNTADDERFGGDAFPLGVWLNDRRKTHRAGNLSRDHIAAIERAAPDFAWEPRDAQFRQGLRLLVHYATIFGNPDVPVDFVTSMDSGFPAEDVGFSLGSWVGVRRREYRDYQSGKLPAKRMEKLEQHIQAITDTLPLFLWDPLEAQFRQGMWILARYSSLFGHIRIPSSYVTNEEDGFPREEAGFDLRSWVDARRTEFRELEQGKLSPDRKKEVRQRIAMMSDMVPLFAWDPFATQFNQGVELLSRFSEIFGHSIVPAGYNTATADGFTQAESGFPLGSWVKNLRIRHRAGKLSYDRYWTVERAAPYFAWDVPETQFAEGRWTLARYVAMYGTSKVPQNFTTSEEAGFLAFEAGFRLGKWVSHRHEDYRAGKLSATRIAAILEVAPDFFSTAVLRDRGIQT